MAIVTRRYKFVGPSNSNLTEFVGNGATQNASVTYGAVLDIDIDDSISGILTTLDEFMEGNGFFFDPAAIDPSLTIEDEGIFAGMRPILNFVGVGVTAVDNPGNNRVDVTIPGTSDGGAVVSRSQYVAANASTSSASFVDAMSGTSITVPINGDYLARFEGEGTNQSASGILEIGISVNSTAVVAANSERESQGNPGDIRSVVSSVRLTGLTAGNLIRCLFRKVSGSGSVSLSRRNLTIIRVQ